MAKISFSTASLGCKDRLVASAYAYFKVTALDLPLSEITQLMGVEPTKSWQRGQPGEYNPSRPDSGWCLHSSLPKTNTDMLAHIESVLALLAPHHQAVQQLATQFDKYLTCVGYYDELTSPGLHLSRETVSLLASLGLAVDADLYFASERNAP